MVIKIHEVKSIEILDQSNCKRKIKMITIEEMINAEGHHINLTLTNGNYYKNLLAFEYFEAESEEEENSLDVEIFMVGQSEIEKIEILDQEQL